MKHILVFVLVVLSFGLSAQVIDDFDDGDLMTNPEWFGDISDFGVSVDGELQLKSVKANSPVHITTNATWTDTCSWEIYVKGDTKLSSSINYIQIYLSADNKDLQGSLNGYYLKVGENGDADKLLFYRQKGTKTTKLGTGTDSTMGNPLGGNDLRLLVTRSKQGEWVFYTDTTGGKSFKEEFRLYDTEFSSGAFFGLSVNFSSANVDRFFFDDLRIAPIFSDNNAPVLENLKLIDSRNIELTFNEALNEVTVERLSTFTIDGKPVTSAQLRDANPKIVDIEAANAFVDGITYKLGVDGLEDLYANALSGFTQDFTYVKPEPGVLRITEIFADPSPSLGLPEAEFVELYNPGTQAVDLSGWLFSDASKEIELPSFQLQGGEFVILCSETAQKDYENFGTTLAVSLPALNNTADVLSIRNSSRQVIDRVSYTDDWYGDPDKSAGGYSLELINPNLTCSGEANWKAGSNAKGGTPGRVNSGWNTRPDETAPQAIKFSALYADTVLLEFDEPLDSTSVTTAAFDLKGLGKPSSIRVSSFPHQQVRLGFDNPMKENELYTIFVDGVRDCEGNILNEEYWGKIRWLVPQRATYFDIVIHEIFADPDPVLGLPPSEFVELYNNSPHPISLKDWTFSDSRDEVTLPDFILDVGAYVLLCDDGDEVYWEEFGDVLGIEGFPGLNNTGELLTLTSPFDLIHSVDYSDDWYDDASKSDGGFSLEMIDVDNPCGENDNWTAAKNDVFGTPGDINSQEASNPDVTSPFGLRAVITDSNQVELFFSEQLHTNSQVDWDLSDPDFRTIRIQWGSLKQDHLIYWFNKSFERNKTYFIDISNGLDCVGNEMDLQRFELALPESPDSFDVVINEVLFNPKTGGNDFIELYNRSDSYFDLRDFLIANRDDEGTFGSVYSLSDPFLLKPGAFVVLTTSRQDILRKYNVKRESDLLEVAQLPSFPDNTGEVVLLNKDSLVIDELVYDDDWHHALLDDVNGFSLERINYDSETQNSANWHSASSSSGGATPTYINSQHSEDRPTENVITLSGESFSPDNDGFDDYLNIEIQSEQVNQSATIKVFNLDGQMVRNLVPHDILGTSNLYQWDGINDNGKKAPIGVYLILFEIVNTEQGTSERFKESVVLSGHL